MKATTLDTLSIAPHGFACGYHRQAWWNWLIGTAFFLGEIGGGLFLVSLLTEHRGGMLAGYLIVMVGKNTAHLLYLGRPARFWRAAMRPDRSWIARGIWATGIFGVVGFVILFPRVLEPVWQLSEQDSLWVGGVAGLAALFIMFYDGLVMRASRGIALWESVLLPVLCLTYAALGGTTLSLMAREIFGGPVPEFLLVTEYLLLVVNLLLLGTYLYRMNRWRPAARQSVRELFKGSYSFAFLGLVLALGYVGTLFLSLVHAWTHMPTWVVLAAMTELTGDFALLMILLKSGLLSPQTSPALRLEGQQA